MRVRCAHSATAIAIRLGLALTALALMGPTSAFADSSCNSGKACFWSNGGYTGTKVVKDASDCAPDGNICPIGIYAGSVKNRFDSRPLRVYNDLFQRIDCIGPGGERYALPNFSYWSRGAAGGHCS